MVNDEKIPAARYYELQAGDGMSFHCLHTFQSDLDRIIQ